MKKDKNSLCLSKSKRRDELHERIGCIIKNTPGLEEYIEDRKKDIDLYETYKLHMWKNKLPNNFIKNKTPISLSLLKNDMEKSLNVDEVPPFISCISKLIAYLYNNKKYGVAEVVNDMVYTFIINRVDCYINRINHINDNSWFEVVSIIDSILGFYTYLEKETDYDKHFCTIPTKIINRLELYIGFLTRVQTKSTICLSFDEIVNNVGSDVFIIVGDEIICCKYVICNESEPFQPIKLNIRGKSKYDIDGNESPYEYIDPCVFDKTEPGTIETIWIDPIGTNNDRYSMFSSLGDAIRYLKTIKIHSKITTLA